jgi:hypothetical protein
LRLPTDEPKWSRFVYGRTLNYNRTKPYLPPPPALPRFTMPSEGSGGEDVDPFDVAATTQHPALDPARARKVIRRTKPKVDATSEVQVEDILMEVYAEDPPPPLTRRSPGAPSIPAVAPHESIALAIASVVPPPPVQSAAVDALLRASDPAFLPFGGYTQQPRPPTPLAFPYPAYAQPPSHPYPPQPPHPPHGYDPDSPSVAPVAFPSAHMALSAPTMPPPASIHANAYARPVAPRKGRGAKIAIWTVVLLVLGVGAGAGVTIGVRNGTYARLRDSAKAAAARAGSKSDVPAAPAAPAAASVPDAPAAAAAPAAPVIAPTADPVAAPAPPASVNVNSLPVPAIAADSSLVTFPASAQGHRVFFDGKPMSVTAEPITLRCGRHMIRIGKTGKPRVTDLACGQAVTLR